jgi:hypothetical protein
MAILLCTSLRPSPKTRTFCNDLEAASCDFEYKLRGKTPLVILAAQASSQGFPRMWLVESRYGEPNMIDCFDTSLIKAEKISSLLISRVRLRRELGISPRHVTKGCLRVAPPVERDLKELYHLLLKSVGPPCGTGRITELRMNLSKDFAAELEFVDSPSGKPCGPQIFLKDYR